MPATNALIHLLALAALLGLAYALLRSQKQKELLLALLVPQPRDRVRVDWPLRFVRKFANACAIPFYGPLWLRGGAPQRIKGQVLAQLWLAEGIVYIKWQEKAGTPISEPYLEVGIGQRQDTQIAQHSQLLSAALQLPVRVVVAEEAHGREGP